MFDLPSKHFEMLIIRGDSDACERKLLDYGTYWISVPCVSSTYLTELRTDNRLVRKVATLSRQPCTSSGILPVKLIGQDIGKISLS